MPYVLDKTLNKPVYMSNEDMLTLDTTRYETYPGTEVAIKTPTGVISKPIEAALATQYPAAPEATVRERGLQAEFDTAAEKAKTFGEGAASVASLGLYDLAAEELGASPFRMQQRAGRNPGYRTAGEIATLGASVLAPWALARTPLGLAGSAAAAVERTVLPGLEGLVEASRLSKVAARVLSKTAGVATEGALLGGGMAIPHEVLSGHPVTGEAILAGMGTGALYGGLAGFGGAVGGELLRGVRAAGGAALSRLRGGSAIDEAIGRVPTELDKAFLEADLAAQAEVLGTAAPKAEAVGAEAAAAAGAKAEATPAAVEITESMAKDFHGKLSRFREEAGHVLRRADEASGRAPIKAALDEIKPIQKRLDEMLKENGMGRLRKDRPQIPRMQDLLTRQGSDMADLVRSYDTGMLNLKRVMHSEGILEGTVPGSASRFSETFEHPDRLDVTASADEFAPSTFRPVARETYPPSPEPPGVTELLSKKPKAAKPAEGSAFGGEEAPAAAGGLIPNLAKRTGMYLAKRAVGMAAGAVLGETIGGHGGGIAGAIAVANPAIAWKMFEVAGNVGKRLLSTVDDFMSEYGPALQRKARAYSAVKSLQSAKFYETSPDTKGITDPLQKEFKRTTGEVLAWQANRESAINRMHARTAPIGFVSRAAQDKLNTAAIRQQDIMVGLVPKHPGMFDAVMIPGQDAWTPHGEQLEQWSQVVLARNDPLMAMDMILHGEMLPSAASAWRQMWPDQAALVRDTVINRLTTRKVPLSDEQIVGLSILLDTPLESWLRPEFNASQQGMYAAEAATQAPQRRLPAGTPKNIEDFTQAQRVSMSR